MARKEKEKEGGERGGGSVFKSRSSELCEGRKTHRSVNLKSSVYKVAYDH